uniref:UL4 n=1 Tax=Human herpesvirus 2 TaxID=10310 RepID=A0A1U9ZHD6_HHV2|nr:nuclear protein UL4 [Human alphaherpesvirus 2]AQZ57327.1 nuclear protein UL4 [Human alphaherpesvirus 2]AQZ58108.1 nuclear protein UL4 [Human alphaherpesvirus 2]AQZ58676.1 nuclear protein UL4 [Human alphaherpesvirus 2]ATD86508.1 UL4 [Human alphaherpesvirus 2]
MGNPQTTIAYSLHHPRASLTSALPDAAQVVHVFESGTRAVLTRGRARQDRLPRGGVVIQHTPIGLLVIIDCRAEFCAYRFIGRASTQRLERWWDAHMYAYPFDSWVSSSHGESVRSATAGILTVVWTPDTIYITATIYGTAPEAARGCDNAPLDVRPTTPPAPVSPTAGEVPANTTDLLVEVLREIQISPTLDDADPTPGT